MSLALVIKSPEGLVLAAESRVTLEINKKGSNQVFLNTFDNATKLFSFNKPHQHIGVVTYGQAAIGQRTAHSYVPEFESNLAGKLTTVFDYAQIISDFYLQQWQKIMPPSYNGPNMTFIVGGFNDKEPHGRVYLIEIPSAPKPLEQNPGMGMFGITWGGQREIIDRLIFGYDPQIVNTIFSILKPNSTQVQQVTNALQSSHRIQIPLDVMALQDCISLARLFISTTINTLELTIGVRGCGGPVDIAIIQRNNEFKFIQHKEMK